MSHNHQPSCDFVTLDADLFNVRTELDRHLVSARFSGTTRETTGTVAVPFNEVWNLSKPTLSGGWAVAGIQQPADGSEYRRNRNLLRPKLTSIFLGERTQ